MDDDDTYELTEAGKTMHIAKEAIAHVLNALRDDPRKYWLMGEGTGSYAKLIDAAAALWGEPVDKLREHFSPTEPKWSRFLEQRERDEKLIEYCQEQGITVPED